MVSRDSARGRVVSCWLPLCRLVGRCGDQAALRGRAPPNPPSRCGSAASLFPSRTLCHHFLCRCWLAPARKASHTVVPHSSLWSVAW